MSDSPAENVGRLKQLQYLNLALNNVERIENLEGITYVYPVASILGHTHEELRLLF